ncbi:hypothetical protein EJB05_52627, partial [Eragrostis curvula]
MAIPAAIRRAAWTKRENKERRFHLDGSERAGMAGRCLASRYGGRQKFGDDESSRWSTGRCTCGCSGFTGMTCTSGTNRSTTRGPERRSEVTSSSRQRRPAAGKNSNPAVTLWKEENGGVREVREVEVHFCVRGIEARLTGVRAIDDEVKGPQPPAMAKMSSIPWLGLLERARSGPGWLHVISAQAHTQWLTRERVGVAKQRGGARAAAMAARVQAGEARVSESERGSGLGQARGAVFDAVARSGAGQGAAALSVRRRGATAPTRAVRRESLTCGPVGIFSFPDLIQTEISPNFVTQIGVANGFQKSQFWYRWKALENK